MPNRKLWKGILWFIIGLLLLAGLQRIAQNDEAMPTADQVAEAQKQLTILHEMGRSTSEQSFKMTVKWQGVWPTLLSPEEAAGALSSRLGLPAPKQVLEMAHEAYQAADSIEGVPAHLTVTVRASGGYYILLRLESTGGSAEGLNRLETVQSLSGESLADEGVEVQWNAAVQGITWPGANGSEEGRTQNPEQTLDQLEKRIQEQKTLRMKLKPVEEFAEELTVSRTYSVKGWAITAMSGEQPVNLQMAVHLNSGTGLNEISFGSPLLTVEY
ncbi:YwmB family TATA-box binding protein [Paenibacillus senegalimassiliensis]|uniref:YwmB family TATA-box binding protein n=1 Tax=Paenibacillus senegalimassiliensis TaxID=1737426 RepID=UPI00073E8C5D|nr:YwmB family TATA-box binding protein [Paenibacillus senegalimassiliensis]